MATPMVLSNSPCELDLPMINELESTQQLDIQTELSEAETMPPSPQPDNPPPTYAQAISSSCITLPLTLTQLTPSHLLSPGLLLTASQKPLNSACDLIRFPQNITYSSIIRLLHGRFLARSGLQAPSKECAFYCRVAVDFEGERTLLEDGSWGVARDLLCSKGEDGREKGRLVFIFAVVERGREGKKKEKGRWWGRKGKGICLIEPTL